MLEGEIYQSTDVVFPFTCVLVDKANGYTENGELMKVNCLYFELVNEILERGWSSKQKYNDWMMPFRKVVAVLKECPFYVF